MATLRLCSIPDCGKPHYGKDYCAEHYRRWKRNGDPLGGRYRMSVEGPCLVEGCGKPRHGKGYCNDHYHRFLKYGDPRGGGTVRGEPLAWIESHVAWQGDGCLTWPFASGADGRGKVWFQSKLELAYRIMCRLAHGEPPSRNHEAAHYCGKGHEGCIHPRHLGWETTLANEAHKLTHGTLIWGEQSNLAKLTEDQVRYIRASPRASRKILAEMFEVSEATIGDIWARRSWKHLDV